MGWGDSWGSEWGTLGGAPAAVLDPIFSTPELATLTHRIFGPAGQDSPLVSNLRAEETCPGGFGPARGVIAADTALRDPALYTAGSRWQVWAGAELVWEGMLLDPNIDPHGRQAEIIGRGWGQFAERDTGRILYVSRNYDDWVPADSDPHHYDQDDAIDIGATGGRILFKVAKGQDIDIGDRAAVVFWAEGVDISSIAFDLTHNGNAAANHALRVIAGVGPNGTLTQDGGDINPTSTNTDDDTDDIERVLADGQDLVGLRLARIANPGSTTNVFRLAVSNLRVRGVAESDDLSASEVMADICGRLGFETTEVDPTSDSVMPLDFKGGRYSELLDHISAVSGIPWMFLSNGTTRYGRFREPTRWRTTVAEGATDLIPITRHNRVTIIYRLGANRRHRQVTAMPSDVDLPDPYAATEFVNTYTMEIDEPQHSDEQMEALAERVLTALIQERYSGTLTRTHLERNGTLHSAYSIRAGDEIFVSDALGFRGTVVKVASKTSTAEGVTLDLAANTPELDRYEARTRGIG